MKENQIFLVLKYENHKENPYLLQNSPYFKKPHIFRIAYKINNTKEKHDIIRQNTLTEKGVL